MLEINLKPELTRQLAEWAERKGQTVDALVNGAIAQLLEDLADIDAADAAMRDYDPSTNVSLEEVRRRLGLMIEFSAAADRQLAKLNPHDAKRNLKFLDENALLEDSKARGMHW